MTYKNIAETPNFIVLDHYTPCKEVAETPTDYQSESELEEELIENLVSQGYEYLKDLHTPVALLANARKQIERLNGVQFNDAEWERFLWEYLDKVNDHCRERCQKVHHDSREAFRFDSGELKNISLFDREQIQRNKLQVIRQFEQTGLCKNRYDVTILVNGLPLVQIELKKRGKDLREAFYQIHRYSSESFNSEVSLYKYLQLFIISNGTRTRYFANTLSRRGTEAGSAKSSYDHTMTWAKADNTPIHDLRDFTATFLQRNTLLQILLKYSVFKSDGELNIMRPYQIAATERIIWKIRTTALNQRWGKLDSGGYIWHTTGSGKTLTSFKASQLAMQLSQIDKVFFVVDRKDLDNQTQKEYNNFRPGSINSTANTQALKKHCESNDNKIIITTLQKLNTLMRSGEDLTVYKKKVVFIFDECHRSQFGEAQRNLHRHFKCFCQFGFTGTPILEENKIGTQTTADIFGPLLHSYIITDAIRDRKVLRFKVDYNNLRPRFAHCEGPLSDEELSNADLQQQLLHPDRIAQVADHILKVFPEKTHRLGAGGKGFNAIFAVSSISAAQLYYDALQARQKDSQHPLKIATIFSVSPNEEQCAKGEIQDESMDTTHLDETSRAFMRRAVADYNKCFGTSFNADAKFGDYYENVSILMKNGEIDLLIVVGMFLTGFDSDGVNTLFVDKNLRYHGLIQAYSRTNRIKDATKPFGNIVTFRDLEQATIDAIRLFAKGGQQGSELLMEKSFADNMKGFVDQINGEQKRRRGYQEIVQLLKTDFADLDSITTDEDKKAFVEVFGDYLRMDNLLRNYDEYAQLKALQQIDKDDAEALETFREEQQISPETLELLLTLEVLPDRTKQDCLSVYHEIRQEVLRQQESEKADKQSVVWDDVRFEVELLKSQDINLDYILRLIYEHHHKTGNKEELQTYVKRLISSSFDNREREDLMMSYIAAVDFGALLEPEDIIADFMNYAHQRFKEEAQELIASENLKMPETQYYLMDLLRKGRMSRNGTDLVRLMPKAKGLSLEAIEKKKRVEDRVEELVKRYKQLGCKF